MPPREKEIYFYLFVFDLRHKICMSTIIHTSMYCLSFLPGDFLVFSPGANGQDGRGQFPYPPRLSDYGHTREWGKLDPGATVTLALVLKPWPGRSHNFVTDDEARAAGSRDVDLDGPVFDHRTSARPRL